MNAIPTMEQIDAARARVDLLVEVRRGTKTIAELKAAFPEVGDFPMVGVYEALQRDEVNRLIQQRLDARERLGTAGGELLEACAAALSALEAAKHSSFVRAEDDDSLLKQLAAAIAAAEGREP